MKRFLGWSSALCLTVASLSAQETNQLEQLTQQLKRMQETFEQQQRTMREDFERRVREQQTQIDALKKQLEATKTNAPAAAAAPPVATASPPATVVPASQEQIKQLSERVSQVVEAQKKVLESEFNPAIGFVGETVLSYRSKGSDQTGSDRPGGFDAYQRSMELNIAGSVDPFARGYVVANASADSTTGNATFGIEEAALQTESLPWNLTLKAGRFFGEFGRLSYIHDHELPFVNRPLALDQYVGGESRTDGAQLNWLVPIPHYVSLTLGAGNGFGGDSPLNNPGSYRSLSGLNYFGRLSTYFNLTPDWSVETGVSGLINPSTHDRGGVDGLIGPGGVPMTEKERRVAGFDVKLNWLPLQNNQFHSFTWGTEVLYSDSRYQFDPDGSLNPANAAPGPSGDEFMGSIGSVGMYSYVTYKWHRQWSGGFLFDWMQNAQNNRDQTSAYSPYITWAISHWNQLRLQYTHTDHNAISGLRPDDAIYLQWAWIIGSHAHGWQQR